MKKFYGFQVTYDLPVNNPDKPPRKRFYDWLNRHSNQWTKGTKSSILTTDESFAVAVWSKAREVGGTADIFRGELVIPKEVD